MITSVLATLPYDATRLPDDAVLPYGWQIVGKTSGYPHLIWRVILVVLCCLTAFRAWRHMQLCQPFMESHLSSAGRCVQIFVE